MARKAETCVEGYYRVKFTEIVTPWSQMVIEFLHRNKWIKFIKNLLLQNINVAKKDGTCVEVSSDSVWEVYSSLFKS